MNIFALNSYWMISQEKEKFRKLFMRLESNSHTMGLHWLIPVSLVFLEQSYCPSDEYINTS